MRTLLLPRTPENACGSIAGAYWKVFRTYIREHFLFMLLVPLCFLLLLGSLYICIFLVPSGTAIWYAGIALYSTLLILLTGTGMFLSVSCTLFSVPNKQLIRNAFLLCVKNIPLVLLMCTISLFPFCILLLDVQISVRLFPLLLFFGLSLPAKMNCRILLHQLRLFYPDLEVPAI
ncbi:MAG: hypothetical protein ACI3V5_11340 [Faecousia sp.]